VISAGTFNNFNDNGRGSSVGGGQGKVCGTASPL